MTKLNKAKEADKKRDTLLYGAGMYEVEIRRLGNLGMWVKGLGTTARHAFEVAEQKRQDLATEIKSQEKENGND